QWIGFPDHRLFEPLTTLILRGYSICHFWRRDGEVCVPAPHRLFCGVRKQLQGHQRIASEKLGLADISDAASLCLGFVQITDRELMAKHSRTTERYS
ncbi:hypothetical protein M441DRAFT_154120, partial [Trichoderma asperellum CBS 433.97]